MECIFFQQVFQNKKFSNPVFWLTKKLETFEKLCGVKKMENFSILGIKIRNFFLKKVSKNRSLDENFGNQLSENFFPNLILFLNVFFGKFFWSKKMEHSFQDFCSFYSGKFFRRICFQKKFSKKKFQLKFPELELEL